MTHSTLPSIIKFRRLPSSLKVPSFMDAFNLLFNPRLSSIVLSPGPNAVNSDKHSLHPYSSSITMQLFSPCKPEVEHSYELGPKCGVASLLQAASQFSFSNDLTVLNTFESILLWQYLYVSSLKYLLWLMDLDVILHY